MKPALETLEKNHAITEAPILIVDKLGIIGLELVTQLKAQFADLPLVFVTSKDIATDGGNLLVVSYKKQIPTIPQAPYSYMLLIHEGEKETLTFLPEFLTKARELKARFILVTPIALYDSSLVHALTTQANTALIFIGDVFANQLLPYDLAINDLFLQMEKGKIKLTHMGLGKVYPVFLQDAIGGILQTMFKAKSGEKIFYLFPKHPPTALSVVRMMQKANPELLIDFSGEEKKQHTEKIPVVLPEGNYILGSNYALEERIKQVVNTLPQKSFMGPLSHGSLGTKTVNPYVHKKPGKGNWGFFLSLFAFVVVLLLLPILVTAMAFFVGETAFKNAKIALEKGESQQVTQSLARAASAFHIAWLSSQALEYEAAIIGKEETIRPLVSLALTGKHVSVAASYVFSRVEQNIKQGENTAMDQSLLIPSLRFLLLTQQQFAADDFGSAQSAINALQKTYGQQHNKTVNIAGGLLDLLPQLVGVEKEKKYLLLFQNNMELRPGGGFIGSYGMATFKGWQLTDFTIHDVYDADGQLKGHIEPPFALRRYFPLVHWYLRDSNFSADFPKNASSAAFFLREETGTHVDGVIGVDMSFVQGLLGVIGPVHVPEYNQTVTAENFYLLTQTHAEKNFFPGSTQKKDFLRALFVAMQHKLMAKNNNLSYTALLRHIEIALAQKHLLFAFSDSAIQSFFTANKLSSALWDPRQKISDTVQDFMGISEVNIGANKANYYVKRKIDQEVTITTKGEIMGKVTLQYKNTSQENVWPGGEYKNYVRIVLPLGTKLAGISLDGTEQKIVKAVINPRLYEAKNFKPPVGLEVEEVQEEGKTLFGFLTIVPTGALQKIEITYTLSQNVPLTQSTFIYDLWVFKQPGTDDDPYSFTLRYPEDMFTVINPAKNVEQSSGRVFLKEALLEDSHINLRFSQK